MAEKENSFFQVEIELSKTALSKALEQFNTYKGTGTILLGKDRRIITESVPDSNNDSNIMEVLNMQIDESSYESYGMDSIIIGSKPYLFLYVTSNYLEFTLVKFIPEDKLFEPLKRYKIRFWIFSTLAVIIILIFSFSTYRFIQKPLKELIKSFHRLETGNLNFTISHNHDDEFGTLYKSFNNMVYKLKELFNQVYKQKILVQKAELKQLQSQINPHFLYNSFFMLHRMLKLKEYKDSEYFSQQLGNYFKFITRNADDEIMLFSEVEHARIYAEIQAIRFVTRLRIDFHTLPEKFFQIKVPKLILQPLIENSIEHGFKDVEENGIVIISFNELENGLSISVEDNGNGVPDNELDVLKNRISSDNDHLECTGIINIHKRVRLKFGKNSGLYIGRGKLRGFKVEIIIIGGGD